MVNPTVPRLAIGILYLLMVIVQVSCGYMYTHGSGRVEIFGMGQVWVRVSIIGYVYGLGS